MQSLIPVRQPVVVAVVMVLPAATAVMATYGVIRMRLPLGLCLRVSLEPQHLPQQRLLQVQQRLQYRPQLRRKSLLRRLWL